MSDRPLLICCVLSTYPYPILHPAVLFFKNFLWEAHLVDQVKPTDDDIVFLMSGLQFHMVAAAKKPEWDDFF